ncbi:MAG: 3,4-dihydroxy-2-butanone-4-phosphate synthase [Flavobacteriaceae bacterium]|nr:3,4-dihydroxy-2-butanone-4-phosphate synthase [Flavobacteriaceae bacterium]
MSQIELPRTLDSIESAIADIKNGKVIIVVDDENRENEGDFVAAAELVTPEMVNFMAKHGRGLICAPLSETRCKELDLEMMVGKNTDPMDTAFTVSVDLNGQGVTTGISASDRAKTIRALTSPDTKPHDLRRPGHIFPLRAKDGGVLRRTGHTEAAIDFARLAGLQPAGVIVEIMNEDGSMARLPQLFEVAEAFDLKVVSIEDLVAYRMKHDSLIKKVSDFYIDSRFGKFRLRAFHQTTNEQIHYALTMGDWEVGEEVLVRVNSSMASFDLLQLLFHVKPQKWEHALKMVAENGKGAVVFINKDYQAIDVINSLELMQKNSDFAENMLSATKMDHKDFGIGAQILHELQISKIKLISNAESQKRVGIIGYGLEITEYVRY